MNEDRYPLATVGGLIFAPDGQVLLVQSKKWLNCLSIPGGKIELGETREQAFLREVKEETRLTVTHIKYAYAQDSVFNPQFWQKKHFVMHQFICQLAPGVRKEDVVLNEEAEDFQWIDPEQARQMALNVETYPLLDWYFAEMGSEGLIGFDHHRIQCIIGHLPDEWQKEQEIRVDLRVQFNIAKSARSERLVDTIDYVALADICTHLAQSKKYHLMESFAVDVLQKICADFPVSWAWIRVMKPSALATALHSVIELERGNRWLGRL